LESGSLAEQSRIIAGRSQTIGAAMLAEREHLLPLAEEGFDLASLHFPQVNQSGCVKVLTNFYSVPLPVGATAEVKVYSAYVEIWHAGQCVNSHCCESHREARETAQHGHGEALPRHRVLDALVHGGDVIHGHIAIHRVHLADDGVRRGSRVRGRARNHVHGSARPLCMRIVDDHPRIAIEAVLFYHANHADNRDPWGVITLPQPMADGIALGPEAIGHFLVDDGGRQRLVPVGGGEHATANQRDIHRPEVGWCRLANVDLQLGLVGRLNISFNIDSSPTHGRGKREGRNSPGGCYAGEMADAFS
jgi:hypothetical protein